jgi:zinc transport system permease protein
MLIDDLLIRATLAGIGVALATGPLGCFVVWRRMAYFGDATAHAAILGVAIALATSLPVELGVLLVALAMAGVISVLSTRGHQADTLLGVLSHSALAFGLLAIALVPGVRVDLSAFLFGDILAVRPVDLGLIWGGAALVVGLMAWRWSRLLTATLNADLAASAGISARREELVLTLALAVVVALSLKVIGALLIAAMLIVPAAAARSLARTPEAMAAAAVLIGILSVLGGLTLSYSVDSPAGPSIVSVAAAAFLLSTVVAALRSPG